MEGNTVTTLQLSRLSNGAIVEISNLNIGLADFPLFRHTYALSTDRACHLQDCPNSQLYVITYNVVKNKKYEVVPIPARPWVVTRSCRVEKPCSEYRLSTEGYRVYEWDAKEHIWAFKFRKDLPIRMLHGLWKELKGPRLINVD